MQDVVALDDPGTCSWPARPSSPGSAAPPRLIIVNTVGGASPLMLGSYALLASGLLEAAPL